MKALMLGFSWSVEHGSCSVLVLGWSAENSPHTSTLFPHFDSKFKSIWNPQYYNYGWLNLVFSGWEKLDKTTEHKLKILPFCYPFYLYFSYQIHNLIIYLFQNTFAFVSLALLNTCSVLYGNEFNCLTIVCWSGFYKISFVIHKTQL